MAARAFQKIYTKITQITKATLSLKATGVGYDELATVNGKLAQVVKIAGDEVTLQVFEGTQGIPTDAEVVFLGKAPTLKVSDQLAGRFFNAFGDPIDGGPEIEGVEFLINCAGVQTETEYDIAVNLTATVNLTEFYAFQGSIKSVVNIASASGLTGSEFPHYSASKGGLVAYTKNLAIRLAPYGATANSLCPGGVITELNRHIIETPDLYKAVLNETLLGKWSDPAEIAQWTYFLACINKSMTGENLLIDNGEAVKANFIW